IAHIDHGWRAESALEAEQLKQLALEHGIPFYLKKLDPIQFQKSNLEMACRLERYRFFGDLCRLHSFQGVLLGHHLDDQSETILKRVLEGSHWSCLPGLSADTWVEGVRVLRPFLPFSKKELSSFLEKRGAIPFEDASNQDERFLRARMRQTMLPWLNENFGKNVQPALVRLGQEMVEMREFFEERLRVLLDHSIEGPFGICLDLQGKIPSSLIEIKFLVRLFCEHYQMNLSYSQYQTCAEVLRLGRANQCFENGGKTLWVDSSAPLSLSSYRGKMAFGKEEKNTLLSLLLFDMARGLARPLQGVAAGWIISSRGLVHGGS
ncbi:MAG: tRNA lysidine(34) synthetase TilS, partial [Chlamydiales bacterium]